MAQMILSSAGQAIGGPVGAVIGSTLGRVIDQRAISGLSPARQKGPRLETLRVQGAAEGAPMACVFGRARVTGQVIWAARFLEGRKTSSGGKGGPRTVEYDYSLSFAVALCEGEIDGIGRVWADGRLMDLSGVTMRVHRGGGGQMPDPLIEAVEGAAPAYRGTAYVVFEDLPLGPYGNRPPQLGFEVFRRPRGDGPRLEDRLEGVCLIPGAGEFVLATEVVMRREGLTRSMPENLHAGDGRADLVVALDQLQAQCPNLKRVSLVVGWFGNDLRAGHCTLRPGVERADKATEPLRWSVAGLGRGEAHLISQSAGGPAFGGTPSDESVRQAVAALKARGLEVMLYPFVLMDVPAGNGLPDPYGGGEQAAYPWRGRIKGEDGAGAPAQVAAAFGAADGWGLRRMALHYAALAKETGADGLLIGSEMRGPYQDAGRRRRLSGGRAASSAGDGMPGGGRAGCGDQLRRRLVGICGSAGWGRCPVPSRSALGGCRDRLCRHRLVPAAGRLARGGWGPRRRGFRRARRRNLSGDADRGRRGVRLVLCLGRRPGDASADADHGYGAWRGLGVSGQGPERLVVERAPRSA
jgi:hypothetical protein